MSTKNLRMPPTNNFQNYTLYHVVGDEGGLTKIADSQMNFLWSQDKPAFYQYDRIIATSGTYGAIQNYSAGERTKTASGISKLDIGFDFLIDGQTFDYVYVSSNGWCILHEKNTISWDLKDYWDIENLTKIVGGTVLKTSTVGSLNQGLLNTILVDNILLCPWHDQIWNLTAPEDSISAPSIARQLQASYGIIPQTSQTSSTKCGVRYFRDKHSTFGQRLIIRWTSTNTIDTSISSVFSFEVVLYENGKIEYRYSPKSSIQNDDIFRSSATIGIFGNTSKNRFRDFSIESNRNNSNSRYKLGGLITGSNTIISGSIPYDLTLGNWPSQNGTGAMFIFSPPVLKQKRLVKKLVQNLDKNITYPINYCNNSLQKNKLFDDRLSQIITSSNIVSLPSKLTRFFAGNTYTSFLNQSLFENDIESFGSNVNAIDYIINENNNFSPYNESNRQIVISNNTFESGSENLTSPTYSKHQINLQFPIDTGIKLLTTQSAIYYYNANKKSFLMKGNKYSYYPITNEVSATIDTDICDAVKSYIDLFAQPEDYRGFDPFGNLICSGSSTFSPRFIRTAQSNEFVNYPYVLDKARTLSLSLSRDRNYPDALSTQQDKSICLNPDYNALNDETFTLPISHPFVIEKATIEFPLELGQTWFNDTTKVFQPFNNIPPGMYNPYGYTEISGSSLGALEWLYCDMGGPALTFGLFTQKSNGNNVHRELILSATLTHENDNKSTPTIYTYSSGVLAQIYIEGFNSVGGRATTYIQSSSNNNFKGNVILNATAMSSNGICVTNHLPGFFTGTNAYLNNILEPFVKKEFLSLESKPYNNQLLHENNLIKVNIINNFGRGQTGNQSGHSIFGKEYTLPAMTTTSNNLLNEKFLPTNYKTIISASMTSGSDPSPYSKETLKVTLTQPKSFIKHEVSPYIVYPNQKLLFSLSKTRPVIFHTSASITYDGGGHQISGTKDYYLGASHDVKIPSGSQFKITLYGSYLKEGKEFIDSLIQPLNTTEIHESINDYVLDQFQVANQFEYVGSYNDVIMTDYDTQLSGAYQILVQNRRNILSQLSSHNPNNFYVGNYPTLSVPYSGAIERIVSNMASDNKRYLYSVCGMNINSNHMTCDETYYDSILPNIFDILKINDATLAFDSQLYTKLSIGGKRFPQSPQELEAKYDKHLLRCFPFEPKYANVIRNFLNDYSTKNENYNPPGLVVGLPRFNTFLFTFDKKYNPNSPQVLINDWAFAALKTENVTKVLFGRGDIIGTLLTSSLTHLVQNTYWKYIPDSRFDAPVYVSGWKYGLLNGLQTNSNCIFNRNHFGQNRDMLEQRLFTKFYSRDKKQTYDAPVTVKFVNPTTNKVVDPLTTWSSNVHYECTSSLPYFDGETRNRPEINLNLLNSTINSINIDSNSNIIME